MLEGSGNAVADDLVWAQTDQWLPEKSHGAMIGLQVSSDEIEKRRFARPVGADDGVCLLRFDLQTDIPNRTETVETLAQTINLEHGY